MKSIRFDVFFLKVSAILLKHYTHFIEYLDKYYSWFKVGTLKSKNDSDVLR